MKQFYVGVGVLLTTVLIVVLVFLNVTAHNATANPTLVPTLVPPTTIPTAVEPTATVPPPTPTTEPEPERVLIPPHTVNGYTATIESYYVDLSHITFQMRITGPDFDSATNLDGTRLGYLDLYDEYGNLLNSSGGLGPATDPDLVQIGFEPVSLLKGDRLKGQFALNLYDAAPNYGVILAKFRFDFNLPVYPEVRFYPKQTVSANGMDILVDSVTVTPVFTQVYLCFQPRSNQPWTIGNETVLQIAGKESVPLYSDSELFSAFTGNYWGIRSEPYWVPPVKNGVCHKIGFQTGSSNPTSLTLTIPSVDNIFPYLRTPIHLDELYPGLSKREAYHTYLDENGYTSQGPWIFNIQLKP